ncbi:MAG: hypothetical protein ABJO29_02385 [Yoonia sp.]|uniref:hypothetical protein n=1 Tax=Rhodobacterales TaxID=204455 RepID=UPI001FF0E93E|nr:hypothetical protein [Loktanella sp. F6476L]MCK0121291.1 hypothetical protein [Loktanella sp. F6476L]
MDSDVLFVVGFIIAVLSIPAIVSAFSDNRSPRVPAIVVLIGALMIGYAINERPGAYNFDTLPDVFVRVIGKVLN